MPISPVTSSWVLDGANVSKTSWRAWGLAVETALSGMPDGSAAAPGLAFAADTNTGFFRPGADTLAAATNGAERMRIDGAGAATFTGKLTATGVHVGGGPIYSEKITAYGYADGPIYTLVHNGSPHAAAYSGCYFNAYGSSWAFRVGSAAANGNKFAFTSDILGTPGDRRVIDPNSGNVGIGVASPVEKLEVAADTGGRLAVSNGGGATRKQVFIQSPSASANYARILAFDYGVGAGVDMGLQDSGGNLGIGTVSPSAKLHNTGTTRLSALGAGTLSTDGSGNVTASSDEALKEEIAPFSRGLAEILDINPISYNWNALSGLDRMNRYHGFSAQDVEAAIPEAVGIGADGFLTLQDRPILAALVNAVKALAEQNAALVARIAALEGA